jgi:hypothetical protein
VIPNFLVDRVSKQLVVLWACAAAAFEVWYIGLDQPLRMFTAGAFIAAAVLAAIDRRAVALVLAFAYVFPILVWSVRGQFVSQFGIVWVAPLLGAILPSALRTPWHIPGRWRVALVSWALVIVASGTIVAAREVDFTPALLNVSRGMANSLMGGLPGEITEWVLYVALVHLVGLLWFDWLLEITADQFHSLVAVPLAISAAAMAALAIYQLFVDMSALNASVFQSYGRASATMLDANVSGTIAAMWIGGTVMLAQRIRHGGLRKAATLAGCAACWLTVWATGSRTAFAAALLTSAFCAWGMFSAPDRRVRRLQLVIGGAAAGLLAAVLFVAAPRGSGPLARLERASSFSMESVGGLLREQLWVRNGYGTAAAAMIQRYPWFGVGVGGFQPLLPEFSGRTLSIDNAQNWYRHQLAEFGVLGSIGWVFWVGAFGAFVLSRRDASRVAWGARGALIAFAAISFVGMPGQAISVSITLWTLAAWYLLLVGKPAAPEAVRPDRAAWIAALALVLLFSAGTAYAATHDLRVPARAKRSGWLYQHGLYPATPGDEGFRWTGRQSVSVVEASSPTMILTLSLDYTSLTGTGGSSTAAATRPVTVKVWRDGELVFDRELTTTAPVTERIPVAGKWVMLETWVSRVFESGDLGLADDRELGVRMKWDFASGG